MNSQKSHSFPVFIAEYHSPRVLGQVLCPTCLPSLSLA